MFYAFESSDAVFAQFFEWCSSVNRVIIIHMRKALLLVFLIAFLSQTLWMTDRELFCFSGSQKDGVVREPVVLHDNCRINATAGISRLTAPDIRSSLNPSCAFREFSAIVFSSLQSATIPIQNRRTSFFVHPVKKWGFVIAQMPRSDG
ncbi:MAG: hypothetical protein GQF41_0856 [Candidatus Rifleibacterium amylolyticum]|nr:MAG: hypothetical protein GQF41_0856 [Candidatus Rifleibacterium amylolyticum]